MGFKGAPQKRGVGFLLFFFSPLTEEFNIKNWRGKLVICAAAPNSFHTVTLGNEVEMTQHANLTVSMLLTRHTAPPPEDASPG